MKHSQFPAIPSMIGGTQTLAQNTKDNALWIAFRNLRAARTALDLNDRDISILQCLIGLCANVSRPVVFASNATLEERSAICGRSLRRHITHLESRRILRRKASPNGKRYVHRVNGEIVDTYGIDLSPLLQRSEEFQRIAEDLKAQKEIVKALRDRLKVALRDLEDSGDIPQDISRETRTALRRRLTAKDLCERLDRLRTFARTPVVSEELAATDGQNDRHHHKTKEEERIPVTGNLDEILEACPEVVTYAPKDLRSWGDLKAIVLTLAEHMAIDPSDICLALKKWGETAVIYTISRIVQEAGRIRRHGAYFFTLMLGRKAAEYDPMGQLERSLRRSRQTVSAMEF